MIELSREVFQLIEHLRFEPRIKSLQTMSGRHRSPLVGGTPDFMEYRDHRAGEAVQDIDWRASGRLGRHVVRRNEHEGLVKHWLVLDVSASMDYPQGAGKHRFMVLLAGALMYLLNGRGDPVGVMLAGEGEQPSFNPSRTWGGLAEMIRHMAGVRPAGVTTLAGPLTRLAGRLQKTSLVWVLTDFDRGWSGVSGILEHIANHGHDLRVIHPYHPAERDLPGSGECRFEDMEGVVKSITLQPEAIAAEYRLAYDQQVEELRQAMQRMGADYHHLDIAQPMVGHLTAILGGT